MRIRYTGPTEQLVVTPAGHVSFVATRLQWVDDVPAEVIGKRPSGEDPGSGLLAQGDYEDGKFVPLWETEAAKKAQATRAANEEEK